jgi:hypothetical protein
MREWCFLLSPYFRWSRSGAMPLSLGLWVLESRHVFPRSRAHEGSLGSPLHVELRLERASTNEARRLRGSAANKPVFTFGVLLTVPRALYAACCSYSRTVDMDMQGGSTANGPVCGVLLTAQPLYAGCCSYTRGVDLQGVCEANTVNESVALVYIKGMELDFKFTRKWAGHRP